jgi:NAD(P)-dependent dehydrogenase (short-subunit alcohol dehydrogenase family)
MTILREEIHTPRAVPEVFRYVANFANCEQWDPGVVSAERTSGGPLGAGSLFRVACKLPVGKLWLDYEIVEWIENERVVLVGECPFFTVTDTIEFRAEGDGTHLVYTAEFDYRKPLGAFAPAVQKPMEEMGRKAVGGLAEALDKDYPAPEISRANAISDRLVLPGVALFARRGYRRGRRHWLPNTGDIAGREVLITGATSGIGYAAAEDFAARGASLTLVARNQEKAETSRQRIIEATGNDQVRIEIAELSLVEDVDALVARLRKRRQPIDVLVNNAGALLNPRQITEEGLEKSFALLLMSPWLLTEGLHPLLAKSDGARVINVVSGGMYSQKLEVEKLNAKHGRYSGSVAYARAKRGLVVLTEEWAESWAADGIVVNAMHPGWADTPGVVTALPEFHRVTRWILRTPEEGADTIVWLATSPAAGKISGKLFLDREPRTTHLLGRTRESEAERKQLLEFLAATREELLATA